MEKFYMDEDLAMEILDDMDLPDGAYFAMLEEMTGGYEKKPTTKLIGQTKPKRVKKPDVKVCINKNIAPWE